MKGGEHILYSPTVCVGGQWARVDSAWEQRKLEAKKMLAVGAQNRQRRVHYPGDRPGRFVEQFLI